VDSLNANADLNTVYKVFFLGRHGEGYHNAAETFYGTPAWNCYWSELTGNATVSWEDADLTPNGIAQALIANNFWKSQIANQHTPYPQSYYTSPLTRCLRTANLTFGDLELPHYYPFVPTVKELFREGISTHTCDHRRSKSYIHSLFPSYAIEPNFAETDPFWNGHTGEPSAAQDIRSKKVLDDVFASDDHTWVSVTSHSGEIASILRVLGHRTFSLSTGAVIPVLVKAQFVASGPATSSVAFTSSAYCSAPPVTSIASLAQGCVCAATGTGIVSASATASITTSLQATTTLSTSPSTTSKSASSTTATSSPAQTHWGQCGGQNWKGATACVSPYTCQVQNPYYSQCL